MKTSLISPAAITKHEAIRQLLTDAVNFCEETGDKDGAATLSDRLAGFGSAALLDIVGEVKMGKSSLINAFLGTDLCPVAPDPCTACKSWSSVKPVKGLRRCDQSISEVFIKLFHDIEFLISEPCKKVEAEQARLQLLIARASVDERNYRRKVIPKALNRIEPPNIRSFRFQ